MLNESLLLVFENWRLIELLKRNYTIKLRNYGSLYSKAVFLVSKYPNNTTDLATAFFKSQNNYSYKYILNSTYNARYYYNNDIISYKKQFDDQTLQYDDVTRQFGDATLKIDDVTLKIDDATLKNDDVTLKFSDVTLKFDDATGQFDDATRQFDDVTLKFDRLVCFTSITN